LAKIPVFNYILNLDVQMTFMLITGLGYFE